MSRSLTTLHGRQMRSYNPMIGNLLERQFDVTISKRLVDTSILLGSSDREVRNRIFGDDVVSWLKTAG